MTEPKKKPKDAIEEEMPLTNISHRWEYEDDMYDEEEEDWIDEEVTPENCWVGGAFSPGSEECEFCPWADFCRRMMFERHGK